MWLFAIFLLIALPVSKRLRTWTMAKTWRIIVVGGIAILGLVNLVSVFGAIAENAFTSEQETTERTYEFAPTLQVQETTERTYDIAPTLQVQKSFQPLGSNYYDEVRKGYVMFDDCPKGGLDLLPKLTCALNALHVMEQVIPPSTCGNCVELQTAVEWSKAYIQRAKIAYYVSDLEEVEKVMEKGEPYLINIDTLMANAP